MTLPKTKPDEILDPSDVKCPGYKNINTAWWDGSQIYGSTEEATRALRTSRPDGKLELAENRTGAFIPRDKDGNPRTGFNDNWWVGMEMLHTLFALEHNALCDMFQKAYPKWTGYVKEPILTISIANNNCTLEIRSLTRLGWSIAH
jgi:hypothetical protein